MQAITTIRLDIAKSVFQVHGYRPDRPAQDQRLGLLGAVERRPHLLPDRIPQSPRRGNELRMELPDVPARHPFDHRHLRLAHGGHGAGRRGARTIRSQSSLNPHQSGVAALSSVATCSLATRTARAVCPCHLTRIASRTRAPRAVECGRPRTVARFTSRQYSGSTSGRATTPGWDMQFSGMNPKPSPDAIMAKIQ